MVSVRPYLCLTLLASHPANVWSSNRLSGAATVQWSSIQTMLEEAECDVLVLLDCCAAASSGGNAGKGVTEVIAACGFEAFAPGVGRHSFTNSLAEELSYLGLHRPAFTTALLHNKVLARLKMSWIPRYADDEHRELRRTPVYIHLADGGKQRCIELGPLRHPTISTLSPNPQPGSSTQSSAQSTSPSNPEDVDMLGLDEVSQTSLSEDGKNMQFHPPQVLISVALEEEQRLSSFDWLNWLTSFPALAKSVHIEARYKSYSTLLLVSLPIALWDVIPKDPAISFIAFVRTRDLTGDQKPQGLREWNQEWSQARGNDWAPESKFPSTTPRAPQFDPPSLSHDSAIDMENHDLVLDDSETSSERTASPEPRLGDVKVESLQRRTLSIERYLCRYPNCLLSFADRARLQGHERRAHGEGAPIE